MVLIYYSLQSAPVCNAELIVVDIETGENIMLGSTELTIAESNITFTSRQLRMNRHYNVTITASNPAGYVVSKPRISKDDR